MAQGTQSEKAVRAIDLRRGVQIEAVTVIWMVIEAAVALAAGVGAGSLLLTAFGLDSLIELVSGGVVLWRLRAEMGGDDVERSENVEQRAAWLVAVTLSLLCAYVLVASIVGLATHATPGASALGLAIALAAVVVMPVLGVSKRRIGVRVNSRALQGDAAESFTCGYMAATVLVGVALNTLFGWWWIENVAALAFLGWLILETREAWQGARGGDDDEGDAA